MGTTEIIIVFSALMALIALVTIGIDWIGKPLKNRRFIPRMYRFDDEKLPVDAYGNTRLGYADSSHPTPSPYATAGYAPLPYPDQPPIAPGTPAFQAHPPVNQPPPVVVARIDAQTPSQPSPGNSSAPTPANPSATPPSAPLPGTSRSAFSDSLKGPAPTIPNRPPALSWQAATGASHAASVGLTWSPGMALDTTVDEQRPSLAVKATRFWQATAAALQSSHFDQEDVDRMASGKAPRRVNPRTGQNEVMQLTGLRQASHPHDVRMRWPGESTDPWSAP